MVDRMYLVCSAYKLSFILEIVEETLNMEKSHTVRMKDVFLSVINPLTTTEANLLISISEKLIE